MIIIATVAGIVTTAVAIILSWQCRLNTSKIISMLAQETNSAYGKAVAKK